MSFNKDELEAPKWMNAEFLKEVLEFNGELKNVSIKEYKMSPATAFGDHFASIMFRANITYSVPDAVHQQCSIIIKTLPVADGLKKDMLNHERGVDLFGTETFMFTQILGKCGEILRKAGYTDLLAAKLVYHSEKPQKLIVFDDLKSLGYFMFPKSIPDDHDAGLVFSKLAQFHAATYLLAAEGCRDMSIKGTIFNMPQIMSFPFFKNGLMNLTEVMQTTPGFEVAAQKLSKMTLQQLAKHCEKRVNTPGSFNVLNHGDYHLKNMMFKGLDEENISQVVLLDFQICHWGSPAYDLLYTASNIPSGRREKLFKLYFDTFTDVLVKSGYKGVIPAYYQLQHELKSFQCLNLFFLATLSPFLCSDRKKFGDDSEGEAKDLEEAFADSDLLKSFYRTPEYTAFLKTIIPDLLANGVFDIVLD